MAWNILSTHVDHIPSSIPTSQHGMLMRLCQMTGWADSPLSTTCFHTFELIFMWHARRMNAQLLLMFLFII